MTASSDTSFDIVTDTNYSQHFAFHGKHLRDIVFFTMKTSISSGQNSKYNGIKPCMFNSGIAGSKLPIDFSGERITSNCPYAHLFLEAIEIRQRLG